MAYEAALQLAALHLVGSPQLAHALPDSRSVALPHAWPAAALLVAAKQLYGLGGGAGHMPLLAKAPGPPGGWHAWARSVLAVLPGVSALPLSEAEVRFSGAAAGAHACCHCSKHECRNES